ncbi:MAG: polysaccharide biosynthesis C-terminal domain-containing protein, partial [Anaerolineae bacterium]|nr:polysaccharide biosynthesis C-terminal domain-containing protein [Anaerolineae bacterium]
VFFIAVIFNVGANLIFLPTYSYRAAAVITIFSEGLLLVLFLRVLVDALRERIPDDAAARDVSLPRMLWRPLVAAGVMLVILELGWGVSTPLALVGAAGGYAGVLWFLRPFDAAEQAQLAPLLPGRLRARLKLSGEAEASGG